MNPTNTTTQPTADTSWMNELSDSQKAQLPSLQSQFGGDAGQALRFMGWYNGPLTTALINKSTTSTPTPAQTVAPMATPSGAGQYHSNGNGTGYMTYNPNPTYSTDAGYSSAQTNPNYVTGQQQLAAPINTSQPSPSNPLGQDLAQKYNQAFQSVQGKPAPTTSSAGTQMVQDATKALPQPPQANPLQAVFETATQTPEYQQLMADHQQASSIANQQQSLTSLYDQYSKDLGIQGLDTQLMDMKKVIDGSENDLRAEITKAGGFATNSQVMALTDARNKQLITNYNNLLQTRNNAQQQLTTKIGLAGQDREYINQQIDKQLNFDEQMVQMRDKMQTNAQNQLQKIVDTVGYKGLYQQTNGDPYYVGLVEKTLGMSPGGLEELATVGAKKDLQFVPATAHQGAGYFDKTTGIFTPMKAGTTTSSGDITASSRITPQTQNNQTTVPAIVSPYLQTASSGTQWVDASTLQGTAKDKTAIITAAQNAGYKIVTNKNQAADLANIQDATNKLQTIGDTFASIAQPNALSRNLYGLGLTKLATMAQTNPQKAAAGALQSVGLDILKAISGVQGFRGNQTAIQQVTEHLPSIYDTKDVVAQKISYINQLMRDREDGILGKDNSSQGTTASGKTFDIGKAKAAGYTDAEIQDYLKSH